MGPLQEPRDALEIFTVRMPMLFDSMLTDPSLLLCVRRLLDTKREDVNRMPVLMDVSRGFAETLISFLVRKKLDSLKVWPTGLESQCPLCLIVVVSTFMTGNLTRSLLSCMGLVWSWVVHTVRRMKLLLWLRELD